MSVELIPIVDFEPGDSYLPGDGSAFTVARVEFCGHADVGSSVERQRYRLVSTEGRTSAIYSGDGRGYRLRPRR